MSKAMPPSWCCQHCGEPIGWLGRLLRLHECKLPSLGRIPPRPLPAPAPPPLTPDEARAERIASMGYQVAMTTAVIEAGNGTRGRSVPPWVVLAEYVAILEARVAKLEKE